MRPRVFGNRTAPPRQRSVTGTYSATARVWFSAAFLSLLLPRSVRSGFWLPLHLALAGAVSVAISGYMQSFASALTAAPAASFGTIAVQFLTVNAGAALIATGQASGHPALVAAGGGSFLLGVAVLGGMVWRAARRGLNRRHGLPLLMYGVAVLAMLAGGAIGSVIGSGAVRDAFTWLALRRGHMALNVLGWASLTIAATMITLLPTILKVRMPKWHGGWTASALVGGVGLLAAGLSADTRWLAAGGAAAYGAGTLGIAWLVVRNLRTPRRWPAPVAARHLVAGVAWFATASVALGVVLAVEGPVGFDGFRPVFLVSLVCGWALQVLGGAWLYLLPALRSPGAADRRLLLAAVERGASLHVAAVNIGLALLALRAANLAPGVVGWIGAVTSGAGGAMVLAKTWLYPVIARLPGTERRSRTLWTPREPRVEAHAG